MNLDPRRALIGLAMAGSLIIVPPAVGYAVGVSHGATGQHTRAIQRDATIDGVMAHEADKLLKKNDNAAHANDNVAHVNDNNDNVSAAAPAPAPVAPAAAPPAPGPGGPAPADDGCCNNSPNNSDSPGNGGNP